jgi:hypothetical protein
MGPMLSAGFVLIPMLRKTPLRLVVASWERA